jgi:hypothetical protein
MKPKPKDISFHYTNPEMVKDLLALIPFEKGDAVLDAGSGLNKVWYYNIPEFCESFECEIEDGDDFLLWDKGVDWVIGNPPYHIGWQFTEKATQIAEKGIAWLVNNTEMNSLLTPRRLSIIKENGFEITHIKVVADKRWFGRYYFLIYEKKPGFISWTRKTY